MNVRGIVQIYLEHFGYDGLYVDDECACLKDDISPADCMTEDCEAGYKCKYDCGDHDFHVGPKEKGGEG